MIWQLLCLPTTSRSIYGIRLSTCISTWKPHAQTPSSYLRFGLRKAGSAAKSGSKEQANQTNLDVGHSRFLAEASSTDKWKDGIGNAAKGGEEGVADELEGVEEGRGKVIPTSSHLFKMILPLYGAQSSQPQKEGKNQDGQAPTVFLLHPSQPLSHVSRLITSSLGPSFQTSTISFLSLPKSGSDSEPGEKRRRAEWSDSTDIGDFVKDASKSSVFEIVIKPPNSDTKSESNSKSSKETTIKVTVPSFQQRTQYLRRRLGVLESDLSEMERVKRHCDTLAHRGARRTAIGVLFALITYWGIVARLTFWDLGWEVMEPVTYLSGLSTVTAGYAWFLWHNREVSYTSVLSQNVSSRRETLYVKHGLSLEEWSDKRVIVRALRKEIAAIAHEYDVDWDGKNEADKKEEEKDDENEEDEDEEHEDIFEPEEAKEYEEKLDEGESKEQHQEREEQEKRHK